MRHRGLDILRGFAILLVMIDHANAGVIRGAVVPEGGIIAFVYWRVHSFGMSGVPLFFVLSGFLISGLLFREVERTGRIRWARFWVRRAFKILPSYALLLTVLAATGATAWLDAGHPCRSLAIHGLFLQNYFDPEVNGPTWSLAVEEHFYLAVPLVLSWFGARALAPRGRRTFLAAAGVVVAACFALRWLDREHGPQSFDWMRTHLRIDSLLVGVCCQLLVRTRAPIVEAIRAHPAAALLAAAALVSPPVVFGPNSRLQFTAGYLTLAIGFALVLLLATDDRRDRWRCGVTARAIALIGRWSYNIYLWHFFLPHLPAYASFEMALATALPWRTACVLAQFAAFAAFSIAFGGILTVLFENPILALRDRIPWLREARGAVDHPPIADGAAPPASLSA